MTNSDELNVWYGKTLVGTLWRNTAGYIGFSYTNTWINNGFSISQQLPLSIKEYAPDEGKAHQFFANLLPEANARMHIVRDLKIANSDFELLKAIGGECAGAFSVLPSQREPSNKPTYKLLSNTELKNIIKRKGNISQLATEKMRPRLSLAGAQDKCPVFFDGNHYFLPLDSAPSTHILKFELTDYRHIPAYEYFLTQLAKTIGLPTVECQLKKHDQEQFLLIKRYDRIVHNNKVKRLHQEDFCQALGMSYERKYQQDGGISFSNCYHLIQQVSVKPVTDAENLLKWQIFNWLAGNSDGHAKNLALLYNEKQQTCLAPFYDLVCTRAIARVDTNLAFSVGEEFNPDLITIRHWESLAKKCNIREQHLIQMLQQIACTLLDNLNLVKEQFESLYGPYPALQRVQMVINKKCRKI